MPNGKPGDHPFTDITVHGRDLFGIGIDDKLRRIELEGWPELIYVAGTLVEGWPWIDDRPAQLHSLSAIVNALIRLLEAGPPAR